MNNNKYNKIFLFVISSFLTAFLFSCDIKQSIDSSSEEHICQYEVVETIKEATCLESGEVIEKCIGCEDKRNTIIEALGHQQVADMGIEPTCISEGLSMGSHCKVCGEIFIEQKILPMVDHEYQKAVKSPTCIDWGYTIFTCINCFNTYTEDFVEPLGHVEEVVEATEPTCTSYGTTQGIRCSVCKTYLEKPQPTTILDHVYENGYCINCGVDDYSGLLFAYNGNGYIVSGVDEKLLNGKTKIIIPYEHLGNKVAGIMTNAFSTCESLKTIVFSEKFTNQNLTINLGSAPYLENLIIYGNRITISKEGVKQASSLKNIKVECTSLNIGISAFSGLKQLDSIFVEGQVMINGRAFSNSSISSVYVKSCTYIEQNAFQNCTNLKEIIIDGGDLSLQEGAFSSCTSLKNVVINAEIEVIAGNVFKKCVSLETITLPDTVTEIRKSAFEGCTSLKEIILPSSIKTIRERAFFNCDSLLEITIPSSVKEVEINAFANCDSLKKVIIESGLSEIKGYTFDNCVSLEEIHITNSIKQIGSSAFKNCISLKKIYFQGTQTELYKIYISTGNDIIYNTEVIYINEE